jgi:hypothetical protein
MGIHYWPARKGVYWWQNFDPVEVEKDFKVMRSLGLRLVRIQLVWEDFQPTPDLVSSQALLALREVLDLAQRYRLKIQVSFFTGLVAGVNFLPGWLLGEPGYRSPVPVYSGGRLVEHARIKNLFEDPDLLAAQQRLLQDVVETFHLHPAVYGWDLGGGYPSLFPAPAPPPSEGGSVGTLQWVGRTGPQDQVVESRVSRQVWLTSILDEDVEEERDLAAEVLPEQGERQAGRSLAPMPIIRPVPGAPAHVLGAADGLVLFDADPDPDPLTAVYAYSYHSALPTREQLAKTLKLSDSKRAAAAAAQRREHRETITTSATAGHTDPEPSGEDLPAPEPEAVVLWLTQLVGTIRQVDRIHPVSLSVESQALDSSSPFALHRLAALVDYIGVRAHPFESQWARSPIDTQALPFVAFLGGAVTGKRVALLEFGLPAVREEVYFSGRMLPYNLVQDQEAADLSSDVLEGVLRMGALGGFCWNFSDFHPSLWNRPPLQQSPATRFSGLLRLDGSFKPTAHVVRDFMTWDHPLLSPPFEVKLEAERYQEDPRGGLLHIFDQFLEAVGDR